MTFALLAGVPAVMLTAMYLFERRQASPLRARAGKATLRAALNRRY